MRNAELSGEYVRVCVCGCVCVCVCVGGGGRGGRGGHNPSLLAFFPDRYVPCIALLKFISFLWRM